MSQTKVPVLELRDVEKVFPGRGRRVVQAVRGVTVHVDPGETLAIVGESGCGKTTLGRVAVGLDGATNGDVLYEGVSVATTKRRQRRRFRREVQMIFQDTYGSLNPFHPVDRIVSEPWQAFPKLVPASERAARVEELLHLVGLGTEHLNRTAAELSGGQRQRVGIARALALDPKVIVCDEPVSALDVSIQAQIINLLRKLQAELGVAYLFISHDLRLVSYLADRVVVMYLGRIVEQGTTEQLFSDPQHPYSQFLLSNAPDPFPWRVERQKLQVHGEVPSPTNPPSGCAFRTRCWRATEVCATTAPPLEVKVHPGHEAACHHSGPEIEPRLDSNGVSEGAHSPPRQPGSTPSGRSDGAAVTLPDDGSAP